MEILEILSSEHSADAARKAASIAETDREDFLALVAILCGADKEMARRAAWAFGMAGEKRPDWVVESLPNLIPLLEGDEHPAIYRNIYRVLQFAIVPDHYHSLLFDLCLKELNNPNRPAAIQVFAMTVAFNICQSQPELSEELKLSIQMGIPYGSAGYRNRAAKILRRLK